MHSPERNGYDIYQLKEEADLHYIRFANTKFLNAHDIPIDDANYNKVYYGAMENEAGG